MDATQKSIDDAYTALHDCDNDANKAVNLLLEGIEVGFPHIYSFNSFDHH